MLYHIKDKDTPKYEDNLTWFVVEPHTWWPSLALGRHGVTDHKVDHMLG